MILLVLFLAVVLGKDDLDCDGTDIDNWGIDFVGGSTKFNYYSLCNKDKSYIHIEMVDIIEYYLDDKGDLKETKNKVTSFSSSDFDWDTDNGTESTYQGYDAIVNTFRSTIVVDKTDALFNLTTVLFKEGGTVSVSDDIDQDVSDFTLKFSMDLVGWPWLNTTNTMTLCIYAETKEVKSTEKEDKTKVKSYLLGDNIVFDAPEEYQCGDGFKTVEPVVETKDGTKIDVCFTFEYCDDDYMDLDPFMYQSDEDESSNVYKISPFIIYLFSLFCVIFTSV